MNTTTRRALIGALGLIAVLAAHAAPAVSDRPVGSFRAVVLDGAADLVLRPASKEAVQVRADDDRVLDRVETRVVDRSGVPTLEITTRTGWSLSNRRGVQVVVDVVALEALSIKGSGDAVAEGLRTPRLAVAIAGAGDVRLARLDTDALSLQLSGSGDVAASGRAAALRIAISGSGDVAARDLAADDVTVSIAGSGDAQVNAKRTLAVSIAGSGDVRYTGEATVKSSIAGSGSVTRTR